MWAIFAILSAVFAAATSILAKVRIVNLHKKINPGPVCIF